MDVATYRPLYETKQDLLNEAQVLKKLEAYLGVAAKKLPIRYYLDFGLFDVRSQQMTAVAEVKCRRNQHDKYATLSISAAKILMGLRWARLGFPFYLAIGYTDGIYVYKTDLNHIATGEIVIRWGGRTDRGDSQDEEPMYHIPLSLFQKI